MNIKITAELEGKEAADYLYNKVKDAGIILNEGTYNIQAFVFSEKQGKEVPVDLNHIKFVLNRS